MMINVLQRRTKLVHKMAAARDMDKAEFTELFRERAKLIEEMRKGATDPEVVSEKIDAASALLHGESPISEEYQEWADEADRMQARISEGTVRKRKGYIPHKFFWELADIPGNSPRGTREARGWIAATNHLQAVKRLKLPSRKWAVAKFLRSMADGRTATNGRMLPANTDFGRRSKKPFAPLIT